MWHTTNVRPTITRHTETKPTWSTIVQQRRTIIQHLVPARQPRRWWVQTVPDAVASTVAHPSGITGSRSIVRSRATQLARRRSTQRWKILDAAGLGLDHAADHRSHAVLADAETGLVHDAAGPGCGRHGARRWREWCGLGVRRAAQGVPSRDGCRGGGRGALGQVTPGRRREDLTGSVHVRSDLHATFSTLEHGRRGGGHLNVLRRGG